MRFDDRLATLLAQRHDGAEARIALWRQLVDLLAQGRIGMEERLEDRAIETIAELRATIPPEIKARTARAFAGRPVSAAVIALYAEEPAPVLGPLMAAARLDTKQWLDLLPTLTPTARALMRHRRDLPKEVERALDSFGPSDFGLPPGSEAALEDAVTAPAEAFGAVAEEAELASYLPVEMFEPDAAAVAHVDAAADASTSQPPATDTPAAEHLAHADGETQIRELLSRIEAYRTHDFVRPAAPLPPEIDGADVAQPVEADDGLRFRFEAGPDGIINWVASGGPVGVVGCSIAVAALGAASGADAHAMGAFRQRAPFRDARFTIAGDGSHGGEWRISAVPMFDQVNGRFSGYRGTARRPRVDEVAGRSLREGLAGGTDATDSLRQLVHELRTPLNAIIGFSEMIEGQYLGPASQHYREKAADIGSQGRRLLKALEDLDLTTRLDSSADDTGPVNPVRLIERLHDQYQALADERGFRLDFRVVTTLGDVLADPVAVERMIGRLLAATLAVARRGETIRVSLDHDPEHRNRMLLSVGRPALLHGRDERTLLDPGYTPEEDMPDPPILGLGFALRLVRNIASGCGGTLEIGEEALILRLPLRRKGVRRGNA